MFTLIKIANLCIAYNIFVMRLSKYYSLKNKNLDFDRKLVNSIF